MASIVGGSVVWNLDVDASKLNTGLANASDKVGGLKGSLEGAEASSQKFAVGVAAAAAATIGFGISSVKAYDESERMNAQLDAVLKSTKNLTPATAGHTVVVGLSAKEHAKLTTELVTAKSKLDDLSHSHAKGEDAVYKHDKAVTTVTANIASLEAQLNKTSSVIVGKYTPTLQMSKSSLIDLSKEIQRNTTIGDEAALAAINMGLTFTAIGKDNFPGFTKAVVDTAYAMNSGMKPSAEQLADTTKQLGKALQDPEKGLGALHRVGVNTDELAVKFKSVTDIAQRQKLIIGELMTEFGGSGAAQLNTFAGQLDHAKEIFNDFQELVGRAIETRIKPLMVSFDGWMKSMGGPEGMMKKLGEGIKVFIDNLPIVIGLIVGGLIPALYGMVTAFTPLIPFLAVGLAMGVVFKFLNDRFDLFGKGLPILIGLLTTIGIIIGATVIPAFAGWAISAGAAAIATIAATWPLLLIALAIGVVVAGIFYLQTRFDIFGKAMAGIKNIAKTVGEGFNIITDVLGSLVKYFGDVIVSGDFLNDWVTHLPNAWQPAVIAIGEFISTIRDGFLAIPAFFSSIWKSIISGFGVFVNGLKTVVNFIIATVQLIEAPYVWLWNNVIEPILLLINAIYLRVFYEIVVFVAAQLAVLNAVVTSVMTIINNFIMDTLKTIQAGFNVVFDFILNGIIIPITNTIISFLITGFTFIRDSIILPIFNAISSVISGVWNFISTNTIAAWNAIKNAITGPITQANNMVNSTVNGIFSFLQNTWNNIYNFFNNMAGSIVDALVRPFNDAKAAIERVAQQIRDAANNINPFVRHSPSLVDNVIAGIGIIKAQYESLGDISLPPITQGLGTPNYAMAQPMNVLGSTAGSVSSSGSTKPQSPVTINIDHVNDMQDVSALGREMGFRLAITK